MEVELIYFKSKIAYQLALQIGMTKRGGLGGGVETIDDSTNNTLFETKQGWISEEVKGSQLVVGK